MDKIREKIQNVKQKLFPGNHKLSLASQNWQKSLGQFCNGCQVKLKADECISICLCNRYCHQECFIKQISPYLTIKSEVKCVRCGHPVSFLMNFTVDWVCNRRPAFVLSTIGVVLIMIAMYFLIGEGAYRPLMSDTVAYSILSVLAVFTLGILIKASRRKLVKIEDIQVVDTKLLKKSETQKGLYDLQLASSKSQITGTSSAKLAQSIGSRAQIFQIM